MNSAILSIGVLLAAGGGWSLVAPGGADRVLRWFIETRLFGIAIVIRLVVGLIFLLGAQSTRWPQAAIVLGVLALLGAISVPVIGEERISRMLSWWLDKPRIWLQAWGSIAAALGAFVIWIAS